MTIGLITNVSIMVGVARPVALRIAKGAYNKYKKYVIPKRSGNGVRVIAQPAREVKAVQRAIINLIKNDLPCHESAAAYVPGASILKNAQVHANARFLLKLDFVNFFPSIGRASLDAHLREHYGDKISTAEIDFIVSSCLWREDRTKDLGLCIGAPSSPFLSNTIMYEFDRLVFEAAESLGARYTRYSDDLSFSAEMPDVLSSLEAKVVEIAENIRYPKLVFNMDKRVAVSRKQAFRVTGLTLGNHGMVTVGRSRKRGVRAGIENFVLGKLDAVQVERLKGELAFVLSIEPGFRHVLIKTHGNAISTMLPKQTR